MVPMFAQNKKCENDECRAECKPDSSVWRSEAWRLGRLMSDEMFHASTESIAHANDVRCVAVGRRPRIPGLPDAQVLRPPLSDVGCTGTSYRRAIPESCQALEKWLRHHDLFRKPHTGRFDLTRRKQATKLRRRSGGTFGLVSSR